MQVDVDYLASLGNGAIPYLAQLTDDSDPKVAKEAKDRLEHRWFDSIDDFREWNYVNHVAESFAFFTED